MLKEECSVFTFDNSNIGNIKANKMEINLSDNTPVQRSYNAIPKALYCKVKTYIEDLLNKKRIIHLKSSYSSSVVLVRMVLCGFVVIIAKPARKHFQTDIGYQELKKLMIT